MTTSEVVWLSIPEVALRFGVSAGTVRAWIHSKKLPAAKVGGSYRVRESDLDRFVEWIAVPEEHVLRLGPNDPDPDPTKWVPLPDVDCGCVDVCRRTGQER